MARGPAPPLGWTLGGARASAPGLPGTPTHLSREPASPPPHRSPPSTRCRTRRNPRSLHSSAALQAQDGVCSHNAASVLSKSVGTVRFSQPRDYEPLKRNVQQTPRRPSDLAAAQNGPKPPPHAPWGPSGRVRWGTGDALQLILMRTAQMGQAEEKAYGESRGLGEGRRDCLLPETRPAGGRLSS